MEQQDRIQEIVIPLLRWYQEHHRVLPWREDRDPYRIWVSEIMLQQTRVAAVVDYYNRFMSTNPTIEALAELPEEELMKLWQGLGYYNRARNLQRAARQLVERYGGKMPEDYDAIRGLPGIGDYTAGAIASIAFGIPVPAVDGNVLRVLTRILGDSSDIARQETKVRFRELLLETIPREAPGEFTQSLMELGALVCLPNGAPLCGRCPVRESCAACREGRTAELPVKSPKKQRKVENRTVFLIFFGDRVALRKRPPKGLLAGLWEYPNELASEGLPEVWNLHFTADHAGCKAKHVFTHVEWRMESRCLELAEDTLPEGWMWASRWELERVYAVPNAFRRFEQSVFQRLEQGRGLL